jgi:hypothetical protein
MLLNGRQSAHRHFLQVPVDFPFPLVAVGVREYLVAERAPSRIPRSAHVLDGRLHLRLVEFLRLIIGLLAKASSAPEPPTPTGEEPIKIPGRTRRRDLRRNAQDMPPSGKTCEARAPECLGAIPE